MRVSSMSIDSGERNGLNERNTPQTPQLCRGDERGTTPDGASASHDHSAPISHLSLDLTKPGDVQLVHRAIVNGWDTPQHVRDQITDQLDSALDAYVRARDTGGPKGPGAVRRLLKLIRAEQHALTLRCRRTGGGVQNDSVARQAATLYSPLERASRAAESPMDACHPDACRRCLPP
jgi:hypothetical protein